MISFIIGMMFIGCLMLIFPIGIIFLLFADIFPDSWVVKKAPDAVANIDNSIHINNRVTINHAPMFEVCKFCQGNKVIGSKCKACGA